MVTISVPSGTSGSGCASTTRRGGGLVRRLRGASCAALRPPRAARTRQPSAAAAGAAPALMSRGALAVAQDHGDRRVHRDIGGAFRHQDLAERAFVDRLDFHRGLVGLDLGDHVAGLHLVALALHPLGRGCPSPSWAKARASILRPAWAVSTSRNGEDWRGRERRDADQQAGDERDQRLVDLRGRLAAARLMRAIASGHATTRARSRTPSPGVAAACARRTPRPRSSSRPRRRTPDRPGWWRLACGVSGTRRSRARRHPARDRWWRIRPPR